MGYVPPLSTDVTTPVGSTVATLVGTANVESIIRANSLDQLAIPAANLNLNAKRLTNVAAGILASDVQRVGQSVGAQVGYPFVVSGCVWTADGSGTNGSMSAGTVMIKGILLTVAAISGHAFAANSDTYVDLADNGDGTANVTFTAVAGWTVSPALANSGTVLNTIRNAVIYTAATLASAGVGQGQATGPAITQPSTTVAAGSNGSNITATPLNVASSASFAAGGGFAAVAHSGGQTYLIKYTGTGTGTLTGVTVISGSGTVSTGDTVSGVALAQNSVGGSGMADMLGNLIFNTSPFPRTIGQTGFVNAITTTQTTQSPVPGVPTSNQSFVVPFIVPPGSPRQVKITCSTPFFGSSAAAGTEVDLITGLNGSTVSSTYGYLKVLTAVASDGQGGQSVGTRLTAPGSYIAQVDWHAGAAGTTTLGSFVIVTSLTVELV